MPVDTHPGRRDHVRTVDGPDSLARRCCSAQLFQGASLGEPPLEASTTDAAEFFRNSAEADWVQPVVAVGALGMIGLLWFLVGLVVLLRAPRVTRPCVRPWPWRPRCCSRPTTW